MNSSEMMVIWSFIIHSTYLTGAIKLEKGAGEAQKTHKMRILGG